MDELGSLWNYQENVEELKHKLLCLSLELDTVRSEAKEEMRKNQENIKNLLNLLNTAQKERDEAKYQLNKIISKLNNPIPNHTARELSTFPQFNTESPILFNKTNSSITESNSLGSSPVDSLFDATAVNSPEFSNFNASDSAFAQRVDPAMMIIENIAKKRALPKKGSLLKAVKEAGPLLQTLMVGGPLPQWRNPPPMQPFRMPPVVMNGGESSQSCSVSMLSFGGGGGGGGGFLSGLYGEKFLAMSSDFGDEVSLGKRARLR